MATAYLDVRIRLHNNNDIVDLHFLAIPMVERHTSEAIFDTAAKAFGVVCGPWRDILIGVSTDGERKMTGRIQGVSASPVSCAFALQILIVLV